MKMIILSMVVENIDLFKTKYSPLSWFSVLSLEYLSFLDFLLFLAFGKVRGSEA